MAKHVKVGEEELFQHDGWGVYEGNESRASCTFWEVRESQCEDAVGKGRTSPDFTTENLDWSVSRT